MADTRLTNKEIGREMKDTCEMIDTDCLIPRKIGNI